MSYYGRNPSTGGLPVMQLLTRLAMAYVVLTGVGVMFVFRAGMARERNREARALKNAARDELAHRRRTSAPNVMPHD